MAKLTLQDFIDKSNKIHNNKYDYSKAEYTNCDSKVMIICPIHGEFEQRAMHHMRGTGCKKCQYEKIAFERADSKEQFIRKAKLIHGNKYDYSKFLYKNNRTKSAIICPIHGEFYLDANHHLDQKSGCPRCNSSKGEEAIRQYLLSNNIYFEEQKTFDGCKDKKLLRFDFYLPKYNLCIEFDGTQHFNPSYPRNNLEKAKKIFSIIQQRDQIKNKYCKDSNINLLRIPYWKIKNVATILQVYLSEVCRA